MGCKYMDDSCREEKMGCEGCACNKKEYKLCYMDYEKAWFTDDFEHQWGDDWDDAPYEHNAGEPYNTWSELIEDNENIWKRKWKNHQIDLKEVYYRIPYINYLPYEGHENSPYSVEDINKKKVPWLHTKKYDIYAGTSFEDFIKIIKEHNGEVWIEMEDYQR